MLVIGHLDYRPIIGKSATFLPTVTLRLPLEAALK